MRFVSDEDVDTVVNEARAAPATSLDRPSNRAERFAINPASRLLVAISRALSPLVAALNSVVRTTLAPKRLS